VGDKQKVEDPCPFLVLKCHNCRCLPAKNSAVGTSSRASQKHKKN